MPRKIRNKVENFDVYEFDGTPGEATAKLDELGYKWQIWTRPSDEIRRQQEERGLPVQEPKPVLAWLGPRMWQHNHMEVGDVLAIGPDGELFYLGSEHVAQGYEDVPQ